MGSLDLNLVVASVTAISVTGSLLFLVYKDFGRARLELGEIVRTDTTDGSIVKILVKMKGSGTVAKGCRLEVFNQDIGTIEPALVGDVRTRTSVELFTVKGAKVFINDHAKQERLSFELSNVKDLKIRVSITSENTEGAKKEIRIADILAKPKA